jgi:hypothetical protein
LARRRTVWARPRFWLLIWLFKVFVHEGGLELAIILDVDYGTDQAGVF